MQTSTQTPTQTYWIRAHGLFARSDGAVGPTERRVAFSRDQQTTWLVAPDTPGWNFSSHEYAELLAEKAASQLPVGWTTTVVAEE